MVTWHHSTLLSFHSLQCISIFSYPYHLSSVFPLFLVSHIICLLSRFYCIRPQTKLSHLTLPMLSFPCLGYFTPNCRIPSSCTSYHLFPSYDTQPYPIYLILRRAMLSYRIIYLPIISCLPIPSHFTPFQRTQPNSILPYSIPPIPTYPTLSHPTHPIPPCPIYSILLNQPLFYFYLSYSILPYPIRSHLSYKFHPTLSHSTLSYCIPYLI